MKTVFKTTIMLLRFLKRRSLFLHLKPRYTNYYLNGDLYVDTKTFGKCYFFSNIGVGDICREFIMGKAKAVPVASSVPNWKKRKRC